MTIYHSFKLCGDQNVLRCHLVFFPLCTGGKVLRNTACKAESSSVSWTGNTDPVSSVHACALTSVLAVQLKDLNCLSHRPNTSGSYYLSVQVSARVFSSHPCLHVLMGLITNSALKLELCSGGLGMSKFSKTCAGSSCCRPSSVTPHLWLREGGNALPHFLSVLCVCAPS